MSISTTCLLSICHLFLHTLPRRKGHGVSAPESAVFASSSMERQNDTSHPSMDNPHPLYYVSPVADRFPEFWTRWWASGKAHWALLRVMLTDCACWLLSHIQAMITKGAILRKIIYDASCSFLYLYFPFSCHSHHHRP